MELEGLQLEEEVESGGLSLGCPERMKEELVLV